jgi:hypothetical protein
MSAEVRKMNEPSVSVPEISKSPGHPGSPLVRKRREARKNVWARDRRHGFFPSTSRKITYRSGSGSAGACPAVAMETREAGYPTPYPSVLPLLSNLHVLVLLGEWVKIQGAHPFEHGESNPKPACVLASIEGRDSVS